MTAVGVTSDSNLDSVRPGDPAFGFSHRSRGRTLRNELALAKRLFVIQSRDSRIGFEATNHYFYVPADLIEKILICRDLLDRWLPGLR